MRWFKKTIVSVCMVLLAYASIHWFINWHRQLPQINPHPKYFITIHGHVAAGLRGKLDLVFRQGFLAWSEKCSYFRAFLSPRGYPTTVVSYDAKILKNGSYQVNIPTERLKRGFCQWKPLDVILVINNKALSQAVISYETPTTPVIKHATINCEKNGKSCIINDKFYYQLPVQMPSNKTSSIILNIKNKGE